MRSKICQRVLNGIFLALIVLVGLTSFQVEAYASSMAPEKALSTIDSTRFGNRYSAASYSPILSTLSNRCSTNKAHVADMSVVMTSELFKAGRKFDNMSFLQQALDATASGTAGTSCEEIFAMLEILIKGGI